MSTAVTVTRLGGVVRAFWETLLQAETGVACELDKCRDNIVCQVTGTFNTETVAIHGSLDGVTYFPLTIDGTAAAAATANALFAIYEKVRFIRPTITSGAGVDIDVTIEGIAMGIDN